jgi:hypothetical protein
MPRESARVGGFAFCENILSSPDFVWRMAGAKLDQRGILKEFYINE